MRNDVITAGDVARAWGYSGAHEQIKRFLEQQLPPALEVQVGKKLLRMYDRSAALALVNQYNKYISNTKEHIRKQAAEMGKARQAALRKDGFSGPGIRGDISNKMKSMTDRVDLLEARLRYLESAFGIKQGNGSDASVADRPAF